MRKYIVQFLVFSSLIVWGSALYAQSSAAINAKRVGYYIDSELQDDPSYVAVGLSQRVPADSVLGFMVFETTTIPTCAEITNAYLHLTFDADVTGKTSARVEEVSLFLYLGEEIAGTNAFYLDRNNAELLSATYELSNGNEASTEDLDWIYDLDGVKADSIVLMLKVVFADDNHRIDRIRKWIDPVLNVDYTNHPKPDDLLAAADTIRRCIGDAEVELIDEITYSETLYWSYTRTSGYAASGYPTITTDAVDTTTYYLYQSNGFCTSDTLAYTSIIKAPYERDWAVSKCAGDDFAYRDSSLTNLPAGPQNLDWHFANAGDCDSIIHITLTVNPLLERDIDVDVCYGDDFSYKTFTETNIIADKDVDYQFANEGTCDSLYHYHFTMHPLLEEVKAVEVCYGDNFSYKDFSVTNLTTYTEMDYRFANTSSCDSVYHYQFTVNPLLEKYENVDVCYGGSFTYGTTTITNIIADRDIDYRFSNADRCDSIIHYHLAVKPISSAATFSVKDTCFEDAVPSELQVLSPSVSTTYRFYDEAENLLGEGTTYTTTVLTETTTYYVTQEEPGYCESSKKTVIVSSCVDVMTIQKTADHVEVCENTDVVFETTLTKEKDTPIYHVIIREDFPFDVLNLAQVSFLIDGKEVPYVRDIVNKTIYFYIDELIDVGTYKITIVGRALQSSGTHVCVATMTWDKAKDSYSDSVTFTVTK